MVTRNSSPGEEKRAGSRLSDRRAQTLIGGLLRIGVLVAAAVVVAGAAGYLVGHAGTTTRYGTFTGVAGGLDSVGGVLAGVRHLRSEALMQLGLLLLVLTPVARVVLSVVAFALERDRLYVVVTLIVLVILTLSLSGRIA